MVVKIAGCLVHVIGIFETLWSQIISASCFQLFFFHPHTSHMQLWDAYFPNLFYMAKRNLGQVYLKPICLAASMICGVVRKACLASSLHMGSSCYTCKCLLHWSLRITILDRLLFYAQYLKFAYLFELCGSLLWLPILPIKRSFLSTPHRNWFTVVIGSGKFLHWNSFSIWWCWWVAVCRAGSLS